MGRKFGVYPVVSSIGIPITTLVPITTRIGRCVMMVERNWLFDLTTDLMLIFGIALLLLGLLGAAGIL